MLYPDHPYKSLHLRGVRIGSHDVSDTACYNAACYGGMQCAGTSVSEQPKNRHLHQYAPIKVRRDTAIRETFSESSSREWWNLM